MRAQELLHHVIQIQNIQKHFPSESIIRDIPDLRNSLSLIETIPGFDPLVDKFRKAAVLNSSLSEATVPQSEWKKLGSVAAQIDCQIQGLFRYLTATATAKDDTSIFVKLPATGTLSTAAEFLKDIEKALSLTVLHPAINGRVELAGWQTGSLWVEIVVGVKDAVVVVGMAAWAAAVIARKRAETKRYEEQTRALSISNDAMQEIQQAQKTLLAECVAAEVFQIRSKCYKNDNSQETLGHIKHSILLLADLLSRGGAVQPALEAPPATKDLFPAQHQFPTIESRISKLTEHSEPSEASAPPENPERPRTSEGA